MTPGFFELATVVVVAAALGIIARFLRQPTILAYLVTGALIAALGFLNPVGHESLQLFSELGVMFLLFLVGLEVNYTSLRLVSRAALILGAFVRFAGVAGAALMLLYYFPVLDFPSVGTASFIVDQHVIYALVLLLLAVSKSGRYWGLDKRWRGY